MKCRYTLLVNSQIKPTALQPVAVGDFLYSFFAESGFIDRIEILAPADPKKDIPKVDMIPGTRKVTNVKVNHPLYDEALQILRVTEGLLSLYGMKGIDFEHIKIEWIPESNEEKDSLIIPSMTFQYTDRSLEETTETPFDLIARALLAAPNSFDTEIPLTFYRRATNDIRERRYIEAFFDFYFMLECLFGNGKTKNHAIEEEFRKSLKLTDAINKTIAAFRPPQGEPALEKYFADNYKGKSPDQIIERIISVRGFLHHHNPKHPRMWHPERQKEYQVDGLILQGVCFTLAETISVGHICSQDSTDAYKKLFAKN